MGNLNSELYCVLLNIVRLRHVIGYELHVHAIRTQLDVCIKDSEQPFMNYGGV